MSADDRHLLEVAMRVCDGDALDWEEVERTAGNPRDRELLKRLRLIHGVAGVCREDDARAPCARRPLGP